MRPTPSSSPFDRLIEDLAEGPDSFEDLPRAAHPFSIDSLEAAWGAAATARSIPQSAAAMIPPGHTYSYDGETAPEVSLDPNKILHDLGLIEGVTTEADVALVKRAFALRNHPDRMPPDLREAATQRMMIANALIDQYVAKLRKSGA
ncbi:molecular chaperone DnaJ [Hyphomicrobium methylovorum]|uniref:J domain-containing protein n=1 Tax=Hyphomicrobium methylovorum TaxID=84 RepID=UPI0015E651B3|nr:J domain-containing protein [Hyphomicrobium methylovorum]MBA2125939.1 molecular chaperone DnaJ [Hyphomicrobium methylovorum]